MSFAATQLRVFIDSKQTLVRDKRATWAKLARRKARREYISEVGRRAFRRVADKGAKTYVKECQIEETWSKAFPTDDRNQVASDLEKDFRARYRTGELDRLLPDKLRPRRRGNPIRKGYSRTTVSDNISTLVREGKPRGQAVAIALSSARESYRERHPRGALPVHLRPLNPNKKKKTKRKATRRKVTRKKATRKKATPKKATRKKVTRKKATRKKATRKKATRKKATTRRRKKTTRRRAR